MMDSRVRPHRAKADHMNDPDVPRIPKYRGRLSTEGLDDLFRFREILNELDRRGLRPAGEACHVLRDRDSGDVTGLHLVLELRDRSGWLVEIPFHLSHALPDEFQVIGEPHLCPATSWLLEQKVIVIRAWKHRKAA